MSLLLLSPYQGFILRNYMQAAASLGIGLAFDPFNIEQKWYERLGWQKIVLFANSGLVAAMFCSASVLG